MDKYLKFSLVTLVFIGTITGCGSSSKEASKENFINTLNSYHQEKGCIMASFMGDNDFSKGVTVKLRRSNDAEQHDALVDAGILQSQDGVTEEPDFFGKEKLKIPTKTYTLSEEGKKIYQTKKSRLGSSSGFCIAKYQVNNIINFSEPSSVAGYTISNVIYSATAQDVVSWASNPIFQKAFPKIVDKLQGEQQQKATLVLMDNGWIHKEAVDM